MTVTVAQATTLLENILFESPTLAAANATTWASPILASTYPTVASLAAGLAATPEFTIVETIVGFYEGILGRAPTGAELQWYVNEIETPLTAAQISLGASGVAQGVWNSIANNFTASTEFATDFGLGAGGVVNAANEGVVVNALYTNILGRAPTTAEITYYENQLNSGYAISTVVQEFLNSPEGLAKLNANSPAALAAYGAAVVAGTATATTPVGTTVTPPKTSTWNLTTGLDTIVGASGNNVINAIIGSVPVNNASADTLTVLDTITGSSNGTNTLVITDLGNAAGGTALPSGLTVTGVQVVNETAAQGANIDTSADFTGLLNLNIVKSHGADTVVVGGATVVSVNDTAGTVGVTAATGAVTVNDSAGTVTVQGGSSVNVTTATGGYIIGSVTAPTGAITVIDASQGANNSTIDGGTTINLTTTATNPGGSTGSITIGGTTPATGAIAVIENLTNAKAAATNGAGGLVTITGGTTVSVTENATQSVMTTTSTNSTLTESAVHVTGTSSTTSVSVLQAVAATAGNTTVAVAGATEVDSELFVALTAGQTLIVGGLTFKAGAAGTTAAQTAAAFANLSVGATQGTSTLGTYSGTLATWNTGAVSTATVVFTDATANAVQAGPVFGGTGAAPAATNVTTGAAATAAVAGVGGITNGVVQITDAAYNTGTNTITSVTENAFASGFVKSDALTSLTLSNSTGQTVSVYDHTAKTLALSVNNLGAGSAVNLDTAVATYTALNIATTGAASTVNVTAAAVTALAVSGTQAIDLTGSTFSALKTVAVTGSAGITLVASGATVTDVNTSGTSGNSTVTIDATKATFEGGAGNDTVTTSAGVSKAISLGAGNNTLTLANGVSSVTALINGGSTGVDTLTMLAADASTASGSALFATDVSGFNVLDLTGGTGAQTVHLDVLGNYNSVTSGGEAAASTLTLAGYSATGGVLNLTSSAANAASSVYAVSSASWTTTPGTGSFTVDLTSGASMTQVGVVSAANVGAVTITATDTTASHAAGTITDTVTLLATSATGITVTGNANVALTLTGDVALTTVNASALTGGLTVTAAGTVAETITGGHGVNHLTASAGTVADTLIAGSGADVLTANTGLDILTGGAGADTFVVAAAGANVNTYSTINGVHTGDHVTLAVLGTDVFTSAAVTLANTAVFQDYANAVVNAGGVANVNGHIGWFQYAGDTYIVESLHDATASANFTNGTDLVVKLTGLVDLSHASFNTGIGTLQIN